jgi:hypothetical protein
MGKSTISVAIFNSYVAVCQRVMMFNATFLVHTDCDSVRKSVKNLQIQWFTYHKIAMPTWINQVTWTAAISASHFIPHQLDD